MIQVNNAHEADICVSATAAGFRVWGKIADRCLDDVEVDMHFSKILSVKYYLRNLEGLLFSQGYRNSFAVFDMTERIFK